MALEVQKDALKRYALQAGGEIVERLQDRRNREHERRAANQNSFREFINDTRQNAPGLDGVLFRSTRWTEPLETCSTTLNWNASSLSSAFRSSPSHGTRKALPPVA